MQKAAGVIITDEAGRLLLVRRGHAPSKGSWSLPAGRVEPGETFAAAAVREAREETGLTVEIVREALHVILPASGEPEFDVRDFFATVESGTLRPGDDATDARWFAPDELSGLTTSEGLVGYLRQAGLAIPD